MNVPVLMYHSICDDDETPASRFVVQRRTFARQLAWLAHQGYRTVPWDAAVHLEGRAHAHARAVVLTFDDGYLDNHRVALPLLLEHGFCATVFAVADFSRRRNWWDDAPLGGRALLEPADLRELASCGMSVGAHGITHRRLDVLPAHMRASELRDARNALEDIVSAPVRALAWPYGAVDEACKKDAADAGYDAGFAVHSGPRRGADRLEVRRTFVGDRADPAYMRAKLWGIEDASRWLWWRCTAARRARHDPMRKVTGIRGWVNAHARAEAQR